METIKLVIAWTFGICFCVGALFGTTLGCVKLTKIIIKNIKKGE